MKEANFENLDDLLTMKFNAEYCSVIKEICTLPFSITYWYPDQINLWKDLSLYTNYSASFIILGELVEDAIIGNKCEENVFLMSITLNINIKIISFFQILSNDLRNPTVLKPFLRQILKNNVPSPSSICISFSYALLDNVSKVLNLCSFQEYILECFKCIKEGIDIDLKTLIYIMDLIFIVNRWDIFNTSELKKFVLSCIIFLSTARNLK